MQWKNISIQFAVGGCGDPDQHEYFHDILKICSANKIVPNFTTSGLRLTNDLAQLCKKYCGAVAVSWYRSEYTLRAIDILLSAEVKTNIHYVLQSDTIAEALTRLKEKTFPTGINAIVFLLHKPVGLGSAKKTIQFDNKNFQEFIQYVGSENLHYKIGFDSCTIPALLQNPGNMALESMDTCEAARWSAYITPDLKILPCSFDNQNQQWAVNLREHSIQEAWEGSLFENFRSHFCQACPDCEKRNFCLGGCPILPQIVLCPRK